MGPITVYSRKQTSRMGEAYIYLVCSVRRELNNSAIVIIKPHTSGATGVWGSTVDAYTGIGHYIGHMTMGI